MVKNKPTAAHDILLILAPPVRLVAWLETVFERKRERGEDIPAAFMEWLARWDDIRAGLPSPIDVLTVEEWAELEEIVP